MNKEILDLLPKKKYSSTYDNTKVFNDPFSDGYNKCLDEVVSVLSKVDLAVVPSEGLLYNIFMTASYDPGMFTRDNKAGIKSIHSLMLGKDGKGK